MVSDTQQGAEASRREAHDRVETRNRRDDVVDAYERSSGRKVRDLEFWEVFAALRYAIISLRTTARGIAYEQMEPPENPEDRVMIRELLEQLLDGSYWTDAPS